MIINSNNKTTLKDVSPGKSAILGKPSTSGKPSISGKFLRLLELGLLEGTRVKVIRKAIFGGPIEIGLRGTRICLRRQEASLFPILGASDD